MDAVQDHRTGPAHDHAHDHERPHDHGTHVVDAVVRVAKPRLRGWLHAAASPLVLAAGIVLVALAPTADTGWASVVYGTSGLVLFATSAVYHRGRWSPAVERRLKRADHANIYLIIAGSYTPIAVTALDGWPRDLVLGVVWVGAAVGVAFRLLWIDAPRWLSTVLYVVLGWSIVPFVGDLFAADVAAAVLVTPAAPSTRWVRSCTRRGGPTRHRRGSGSTRCSTR